MTTLGVLTNSAIHLLIKISVQLQHCATSFLCIDHVPDLDIPRVFFHRIPPRSLLSMRYRCAMLALHCVYTIC